MYHNCRDFLCAVLGMDGGKYDALLWKLGCDPLLYLNASRGNASGSTASALPCRLARGRNDFLAYAADCYFCNAGSLV